LSYQGQPAAPTTLTILGGHLLYPSLNQGVAVRAQEHALPGLGSHPADPSRQAIVTQVKKLLRWISVVELKSRLMLLEATDPASASRFVNKLALDLTTAFRDRRNAAFEAAKTSVRPLKEGSVTVARAL
jgi:chemotaxis methyl-accepting protein methylase